MIRSALRGSCVRACWRPLTGPAGLTLSESHQSADGPLLLHGPWSDFAPVVSFLWPPPDVQRAFLLAQHSGAFGRGLGGNVPKRG